MGHDGRSSFVELVVRGSSVCPNERNHRVDRPKRRGEPCFEKSPLVEHLATFVVSDRSVRSDALFTSFLLLVRPGATFGSRPNAPNARRRGSSCCPAVFRAALLTLMEGGDSSGIRMDSGFRSKSLGFGGTRKRCRSRFVWGRFVCGRISADFMNSGHTHTHTSLTGTDQNRDCTTGTYCDKPNPSVLPTAGRKRTGSRVRPFRL